MYGLVADVPRYSEFLAWCSAAEIVSSNDEAVVASVSIAYKGLHRTFTTRNRNQPPGLITMELVDGPFRHLQGQWKFEPLAPDASRIEFELSFSFKNALVEHMLGNVFTRIANEQVDAFHARARQLYG